MFTVFISVVVAGFAGLVVTEIIEGQLVGVAVFAAVYPVLLTVLNTLTSKLTNRPTGEQSGFPWIRTFLGSGLLGAATFILTAMVYSDEYGKLPEEITFILLFGMPVTGFFIGYLIGRSPSRSAVVAAGLMGAIVGLIAGLTALNVGISYREDEIAKTLVFAPAGGALIGSLGAWVATFSRRSSS